MNAIKMLIPPKPILEDAIGYHGEARYIALWWEPAGDEAMLSDGRITFCTNWWSFLELTKANQVNLMPYQLGSSEEAAEHWLLIDLQERTGSAGITQEIEQFVRRQWPHSELPVVVRNLTSEEMEEVIRGLQEEMRKVRGEHANLLEAWNTTRAAEGRLENWLREHRGRWCVRGCADGDLPVYRVVQVPADNLAGEPMAEWPERFALWNQAVQVASLLEMTSIPRSAPRTPDGSREPAMMAKVFCRTVKDENDRDN